MERTHLVRDAIHGNIELTPAALALVDAGPLQRLRYVHQLSFAYLVYPSATHTRFEHSLGAYHLTRTLAQRLELPKDEAERLGLAGLLHDVGHPVFSHSAEAVLAENGDVMHEEQGFRLVEKSELADALRANGFEPREVVRLLRGQGRGALVSWEFGTDRVDYLLRDAYFTGVAYSLIDAERLQQSIALDGNELVLNEKGRLAAESLLVSRHFMFAAVYSHPALRIAEEMANNALRAALRDSLITVDDVRQGTDLPMLSRLQQDGNVLADRLLRRRLFKKALVVEAEGEKLEKLFAARGAKPKLVKALADEGFGLEDAVVCWPNIHAKPVTARVRDEPGKTRSLYASSPLLQSLRAEETEKLIVGCRKEDRTRVARVAREFFDAT